MFTFFTPRDDDDYSGSNESFYEGQSEPTYIPIRYAIKLRDVRWLNCLKRIIPKF